MSKIQLRAMQATDRTELAALICASMNAWWAAHGRPPRFPGGPADADVYFQVYEALDPGCGVVAVDERTGRLAGSCFYHPRPTHVSVGVMNAHPDYFGQGVARRLLQHVIRRADELDVPLRLVSSAMNLDSFSLYTRAGFVPQRVYHDMRIEVPPTGLEWHLEGARRVRPAVPQDAAAMAALEMELIGIRREQDFRYCIANSDGFWHASIYENDDRGIDGFMISSKHPGCNMIGPGVARTAEQAAALILAELAQHRGLRPLLMIPADSPALVRQMYAWGARNCDVGLLQTRGPCRPIQGVSVPTFLPETA